jgi:hypothetical protein
VELSEAVDDASASTTQTLPRIELDQFEGPFDVLLYLSARRNSTSLTSPLSRLPSNTSPFSTS